MKHSKILTFTALFLAAASVSVQAELLYAVSTENDLVSFQSSSPGTILSAHAISGLQGSEEIRGIDFGTNGQLYALGSAGNLYTIQPTNGAATLVGHFGVLNGTAFGFADEPA